MNNIIQSIIGLIFGLVITFTALCIKADTVIIILGAVLSLVSVVLLIVNIVKQKQDK